MKKKLAQMVSDAIHSAGSRTTKRLAVRKHQVFATAVPRVAARTARKAGGKKAFILGDQSVTDEEFGRVQGVLPVIVWHANALASNISESFSFKPQFYRDAFSMTGFGVRFDTAPAFASSTLAFIQEAIHDACENLPKNDRGLIVLDGLVAMFKDDLEQRYQIAPNFQATKES